MPNFRELNQNENRSIKSPPSPAFALLCFEPPGQRLSAAAHSPRDYDRFAPLREAVCPVFSAYMSHYTARC